MTWHRFIVFANEPITIAVVVTVGGGFFLQQILREQDQKRARRELGEALVVEMTGCAYGIYHQLQNRYRNTAELFGDSPSNDLEDQYTKFRIDAATVQAKLETHFYVDKNVHAAQSDKTDRKGKHARPIFVSGSEPWTYWHGVIDILTLDYTVLVDEPETVRDVISAVEYHVGLGGEDLVDHAKRVAQFEKYLNSAKESVIKESVDRRWRRFLRHARRFLRRVWFAYRHRHNQSRITLTN